jgi:hypothetical protein
MPPAVPLLQPMQQGFGVICAITPAVNKGVHYNEWGNFGCKDFEPVVAAYRELVEHFRCTGCAGFLYVAPARGPAEALRCSCMGINLTLVSRPRTAQ